MSSEASKKPAISITQAIEQAINAELKQSYADIKDRVKELTGKNPSNTIIARIRKKINAPALHRGRKKKHVVPKQTTAFRFTGLHSDGRSCWEEMNPIATSSKAAEISALELVEFTKAYRHLQTKHGDKFNDLVVLSGKL